MRQKEEEYHVFKRSKLLERAPSNRKEKENGKGDGLNELIIILKELKKDLKEKMADLRKQVREIMEYESGRFGEKRMDAMEKK